MTNKSEPLTPETLALALDIFDGAWSSVSKPLERDEKKLERVARVRRAIKAAYYDGIDLDADVLANAALSAIDHNN